MKTRFDYNAFLKTLRSFQDTITHINSANFAEKITAMEALSSAIPNLRKDTDTSEVKEAINLYIGLLSEDPIVFKEFKTSYTGTNALIKTAIENNESKTITDSKPHTGKGILRDPKDSKFKPTDPSTDISYSDTRGVTAQLATEAYDETSLSSKKPQPNSKGNTVRFSQQVEAQFVDNTIETGSLRPSIPSALDQDYDASKKQILAEHGIGIGDSRDGSKLQQPYTYINKQNSLSNAADNTAEALAEMGILPGNNITTNTRPTLNRQNTLNNINNSNGKKDKGSCVIS